MQAPIDISTPKTSADTGAISVVIISENLTTNARAMEFAHDFADSLGCSCDLSDCMWYSDLFEQKDFAEEAMSIDDDANYVIVSLLGEHILPIAARNWIELWAEGTGRRGAGLIVLADAGKCACRVVKCTRQYLECVCNAKGVAFSSHVFGVETDVPFRVLPKPFTIGELRAAINRALSGRSELLEAA